MNTNFGEGDYCVHATYNRAHMPETVEEAEANVQKYIQRLEALTQVRITYVSVGPDRDQTILC